MATCIKCGEKKPWLELTTGLGCCSACEELTAVEARTITQEFEAAKQVLEAEAGTRAPEEERAERAVIAAVIVTTEQTLPVTDRLGVVGAEIVYGSGPLKDLKAGFRNLVGGRSSTVERLINDGRTEAIEELKTRALAMGGNAVIAVRFTYDTPSTSAGTMVVVTATGTAVRL